jgi:hypothetical protein
VHATVVGTDGQRAVRPFVARVALALAALTHPHIVTQFPFVNGTRRHGAVLPNIVLGARAGPILPVAGAVPGAVRPVALARAAAEVAGCAAPRRLAGTVAYVTGAVVRAVVGTLLPAAVFPGKARVAEAGTVEAFTPVTASILAHF